MSAAGARAAAGAAVRLLGGATAVVRVPSPPLANADAEELGMPAPEFHDLVITPCAVRTLSNGDQLLLADAATLEAALGVQGDAAAQSTLQGAAFVQVNGAALLLRGVDARSFAGRAYLYRLLLRTADAEREAEATP